LEHYQVINKQKQIKEGKIKWDIRIFLM
jgi:hypothetical protein